MRGRPFVKAIVLAGERPGGNRLARELDLAASVLVEVAGRASIERVIATLRAAGDIEGGAMVGPSAAVCGDSPTLASLLQTGDYTWVEPAAGPAESVMRALDTLQSYPVLVTTGDHALLTPETVAQFVASADPSADAVVGLVSHARVLRRFPDTRRTRLNFREGGFCGTNLFLLRNRTARAAIRFWSCVQQDRKHPWRIAKKLGVRTLWRYLRRTLAIGEAFATLSRLAGCCIAWVELCDECAAIDVDSRADLELAERIASSAIATRQAALGNGLFGGDNRQPALAKGRRESGNKTE